MNVTFETANLRRLHATKGSRFAYKLSKHVALYLVVEWESKAILSKWKSKPWSTEIYIKESQWKS